jgi:tetratricopeptide (TPR) repeat protein
MRTAIVAIAVVSLAPSWARGQAPGNAEEADRAYQAKDWATAARLYEALARTKPESPLFKMRLGASYLGLGRVDDARAALTAASEDRSPFGAAALFHLARLETRAGRKEEGIAALDKATGRGFAQVALLENEADFSGLRDDARFKAVVAAADRNARPCAYRPEARQFDFWLGEWDVEVGGATVGASRIEKILNDCVVLENWTSANGYVGKSFNIYDTEKKRWQQTWVDGTGRITEYYGALKDGNLYYTSEQTTTSADGKREHVLGRMTFFNLGPDRVRQLWEQSTDEGKTWTVAFDGLYTRKRR